MTDPTVFVPELVQDLRALGVRAGDVVMVHASLRALGPRGLAADADAVIDALEAAVGESGTLLMTLGARDGVPFDAGTTPADPDNGVLAEVFRKRAGTRVSDHPEGRFGARGRHADALVATQPWHDYYGPGSPLERLCDLGGRVLRLGADRNTLTLVHYAENLVSLPGLRRVGRTPLVATRGAPERRQVSTLDDSDGIVDWPGEDYFAVLLDDYLAAQRAMCGRIGHARSELLDARDLVAFAVDWMTDRFAPLVA